MSAREEAACLRGVIQSIATIGGAAVDPLAKAMFELAKQGLAAADRVSEKADEKRARQRESYQRIKVASGPPPDVGTASGARRVRVGSASEGVGKTAEPLSDSPETSSSLDGSSLSDSVDLDPGGLRASEAERNSSEFCLTNSDAIPTAIGTEKNSTSTGAKRGRKARANTSAADPSDVAEWARWCAAWGLDAQAAEVKRFADYYRARGLTWRDWKAAWRNWERRGSEMNGRRPPPPVQPPPANGQRLWKAGDGT